METNNCKDLVMEDIINRLSRLENETAELKNDVKIIVSIYTMVVRSREDLLNTNNFEINGKKITTIKDMMGVFEELFKVLIDKYDL